ncbi:MAG: SGNH/GDSL hydrolase family protein [Ramlibacter sp.]
MDRRAVIGWMGAVLLSGCGGGGGGGDAPVPAPVPAPAAGTGTAAAPVAAGVPLSSNIALWGDSLTWGYAPLLQVLEGSRTVYNGGVIGETSMQIADRQTADTEHRDWITVFWYGHNNLKDPALIDLQRDPAQIKADLARSVATLAPGNNRFLVLSVVNQDKDGERRGEPVYQAILQLNAELAATYPNNYFDIRSWMVSQYDPTSAGDVADFQADLPPRSMRFDEIHLTLDGYTRLARKMKDVLDARGW